MRYIITESRLDEFINRYLDNIANSNIILERDRFIWIEEIDYQDGDGDIFQYMEHDDTDGRLWINKIFLKRFSDMFGFDDWVSASKSISGWFENRFNVKVKFIE